MLTRDNYFSLEASEKYMSVSQFKSFLECESKAMAEIRGDYKMEQSKDMKIGSFVHAWNAGELHKFKQENPDIYKKDGTLYSEYKNAGDIIEAIESDVTMVKVLSGQKEVVFTASMFGCDWKIMIDSYNPAGGYFTDLKIMRGFYEGYWLDETSIFGKLFMDAPGTYRANFIESYGYDVQMAVYSEIERLANGNEEPLQPHIAAITKQDPPDKAVFIGFLRERDRLLAAVQKLMPHVLDVKQHRVTPVACGKCEYCRAVKSATITDIQYLKV